MLSTHSTIARERLCTAPFKEAPELSLGHLGSILVAGGWQRLDRAGAWMQQAAGHQVPEPPSHQLHMSHPLPTSIGASLQLPFLHTPTVSTSLSAAKSSKHNVTPCMTDLGEMRHKLGRQSGHLEQRDAHDGVQCGVLGDGLRGAAAPALTPQIGSKAPRRLPCQD